MNKNQALPEKEDILAKEKTQLDEVNKGVSEKNIAKTAKLDNEKRSYDLPDGNISEKDFDQFIKYTETLEEPNVGDVFTKKEINDDQKIKLLDVLLFKNVQLDIDKIIESIKTNDDKKLNLLDQYKKMYKATRETKNNIDSAKAATQKISKKKRITLKTANYEVDIHNQKLMEQKRKEMDQLMNDIMDNNMKVSSFFKNPIVYDNDILELFINSLYHSLVQREMLYDAMKYKRLHALSKYCEILKSNDDVLFRFFRKESESSDRYILLNSFLKNKHITDEKKKEIKELIEKDQKISGIEAIKAEKASEEKLSTKENNKIKTKKRSNKKTTIAVEEYTTNTSKVALSKFRDLRFSSRFTTFRYSALILKFNF